MLYIFHSRPLSLLGTSPPRSCCISVLPLISEMFSDVHGKPDLFLMHPVSPRIYSARRPRSASLYRLWLHTCACIEDREGRTQTIKPWRTSGDVSFWFYPMLVCAIFNSASIGLPWSLLIQDLLINPVIFQGTKLCCECNQQRARGIKDYAKGREWQAWVCCVVYARLPCKHGGCCE
jgi:hypothetical protein